MPTRRTEQVHLKTEDRAIEKIGSHDTIRLSGIMSIVLRRAYLLLLWIVLAFHAVVYSQDSNKGSAVLSESEEATWWSQLSSTQQEQLVNLFDSSWFSSLSGKEKIAYCRVAYSLYTFLGSGIDSHPDDSYVGFAPLLLRTSFHSSGTYHAGSGSGGSNGGTIFNPAELEDDENACVGNATKQLHSLLNGSALVSLADAVVIGGVVALDTMKYPRMDLVRVQGGRLDVERLAVRQSLPSPDNDPMEHFVTRYNLTVSEVVALIGGAHNFGSAHGRCSGYIGQFTSDPLAWANDVTGEPEYFVDLVRDDWRWYKVCTFVNGTASYESIPDPFAAELPEPVSDTIPPYTCATLQSEEAIVCEEQAMRGCAFADGLYGIADSPCDISLLQFRVRADFFLRSNPTTRPYVDTFAKDANLLASEFGNAYHKLTHNGVGRCGLNGHGCPSNYKCVHAKEVDTGRYLSSSCVFLLDTAGNGAGSYSSDEENSKDSSYGEGSWSLGHAGSIVVLLLWLFTALALLWVACKPSRKRTTWEGHDAAKADSTTSSDTNPEVT
jgi:Peroxidase